MYQKLRRVVQLKSVSLNLPCTRKTSSLSGQDMTPRPPEYKHTTYDWTVVRCLRTTTWSNTATRAAIQAPADLYNFKHAIPELCDFKKKIHGSGILPCWSKEGECCWAITQESWRLCCGRLCSSVLEYAFQPGSTTHASQLSTFILNSDLCQQIRRYELTTAHIRRSVRTEMSERDDVAVMGNAWFESGRNNYLD